MAEPGKIILPVTVGPVRIAFLSSEVAPFAKSGGLADVAFSLPKALSKLGHDARVFMPLYARIDRARYGLRPLGPGPIEIRLLGQTVPFALLTAELPGTEAPVYFVDCPRFYGRPSLYTNDADEPLRFLYFSRAVFEICQRLGFSPDILHANDWQTALVPLLKKTLYSWDQLFQPSRTVLTIHNIAYQGIAPAGVVQAIGLDRGLFDPADLRAGRVNLLKTGIVNAERLTTVSPTYALEIQTEAQGYGLDAVLRSRTRDLTGILNGVDYDEWDPRVDSHLAQKYSPADTSGKAACKSDLLRAYGLPEFPDLPLVGITSRLVWQKGFDIVAGAWWDLLQRPLRMVVLGSGEASVQDGLRQLALRAPDRFAVRFAYDEALAHKIMGGADLFLMPSRSEPCGLTQMYALRYGTIPIVRATGGLADTVEPFDAAGRKGTGFRFATPDGTGLVWALDQALAALRNARAWEALMRRAMEKDFSWERSARGYVDLYRRAISRV